MLLVLNSLQLAHNVLHSSSNEIHEILQAHLHVQVWINEVRITEDALYSLSHDPARASYAAEYAIPAVFVVFS